MALKKICSECPDHSTCEGICSRLEEELAKYTKELDYREVLKSNEDIKKVVEQDSYSNESELMELIEKHIKAPLPEEFKYETLKSNFPNINFGYITPQDFDELMEQLFYRRNYEDKKNKNYFFSFLKCQKIKEIALLAGSSEQNMQKKFQGWLKKAAKIFSKDEELINEIVTPAKFKKYLVIT